VDELEFLVTDEHGFSMLAAGRLAELLARAVEAHGRATWMLAGGSTPRAIYARLAEPPLKGRVPWEAIDVYFGDERRVPPADARSNYAMALECLLAKVPIAPGRVHRIEAERAEPERAAEEYDALLPDRVDVLLLGIGADGHTASIFPGSPALRERGRRVLVVTSPSAPHGRLTITPPVIEAARTIVVVAQGSAKADAVERAITGPFDPRQVPAQLARRATWILDREAASGVAARRGCS
jgi:6-phosphogluconolactonase